MRANKFSSSSAAVLLSAFGTLAFTTFWPTASSAFGSGIVFGVGPTGLQEVHQRITHDALTDKTLIGRLPAPFSASAEKEIEDADASVDFLQWDHVLHFDNEQLGLSSQRLIDGKISLLDQLSAATPIS